MGIEPTNICFADNYLTIQSPVHKFWWARRDLNPRSTNYEFAALTTKLQAQQFGAARGTRTPIGHFRRVLPYPLDHRRKFWCEWRDSNSQAFRRQILSLLCIPFHHTRNNIIIPQIKLQVNSWYPRSDSNRENCSF